MGRLLDQGGSITEKVF